MERSGFYKEINIDNIKQPVGFRKEANRLLHIRKASFYIADLLPGQNRYVKGGFLCHISHQR